ncbi:alpha/beta hydrolase fold domain-containing protein [Sarocladium implicatum]|nr:alpha/beta hydrolase fold domain-containing protein [Sarocladium implicatum]
MRVNGIASLWFCLASLSQWVEAKEFVPTIEWYRCPAEFPKAIECGQMQVPMNHADPKGKTITLRMARLRASSSCKSKPVLFNENGGPGVSNAQSVIQFAQFEAEGEQLAPALAAMRKKFDLVGVDIRGTGYSQPIYCDPKLWNEVQYPLINDEATYNATLAKAKAWGDSCRNMTGPLIDYLGTDQTVQDLDMVRRALKQKKLHYQGLSWGTTLGAYYAEKYPDKVGRMVLDGVVHHSLSPEDEWLSNAIGLESTFDYFFRWCASSKECALHGQDASQVFETLYHRADQGKLFSKGCVTEDVCYKNRQMRSWEYVLILASHLHDGITSKTYNPNSTESFQAVAQGLNATLVENNSKYIPILPVTANSSSPTFTSYSEIAISCSDRPLRRTSVGDFRNMNTVSRIYAPHSRGISLTQQRASLCAAWPSKALNPPRPLDVKQTSKLPPIMLVSSFYDPSTVLLWGLGMRASLPTAFSVYRNGPGHTSFGHQGHTAWAEAAFLVNGTIPMDGKIYQD